MSEQAKIIAEMQEIIMGILKTGSVTAAEGARIDELEALMLKQKSYEKIEHAEYDYIGEEIVALFHSENYMEAIDKMMAYDITPVDFFGFAEYHYEDESETEMFTYDFMTKVNQDYQEKKDALDS